ncbi:phosphatase PAP2 family protein [Neobacillus sp. PS3-40]|uniref:phosphatase PAP2 family protein n=1 Tax=Neobacillus sp. PS3-40 TaxID=3070679 RepID=UPI0027DF17A0|nr:phosphatase PAP2 family protein [Neobacillus sp. PS3-40]WML44873.1 phosphatase PAP2 family protein [Neobacillus sp. PS3-40]
MDYRIFRLINQFAGRYQHVDKVIITFSQKVRYLFFFILIFMWFRNNFHKKITLNALLSVGISIIMNKVIKLFYFKRRPFLNLWVHLLPPSPSKSNSSFPSKHTVLAFAAATSIILYKRVLGCVMCFFALLAGFSRIWMGQHYPSDIVGSALLGFITSIVVKLTGWIWNPIIKRVLQNYNGFCSMLKNHIKNSLI